ncbi:MAG: hypothetical protein SGI86_05825 [Deltaproteobacteria bacterium]|nr:hypothetical protein [Deltaproteobacteria bacterium]
MLLAFSLWLQHAALFAAEPAYNSDQPEVQAFLDRLDIPTGMRDSPEVQRLVENELGPSGRVDDPGYLVATPPEPRDRRLRAAPAWADFLPRLSATASVATMEGQRDSRAVLSAEIPIEPRPERPVLPRPTEDDLNPRIARIPACLAELREVAVALIFAEGSRARSLLSRARIAGWLPELRFRVERRMGRNESLDIEEAVGVAPLGLDTIDDVRYEVRATLDLGRAIFNPQELAASQQALRIADARREVQREVNRLFFERRRLRSTLEIAFDKDIEGVTRRETTALRLATVEADIEALTAGQSQKCR